MGTPQFKSYNIPIIMIIQYTYYKEEYPNSPPVLVADEGQSGRNVPQIDGYIFPQIE
jgi:hypothetical protein